MSIDITVWIQFSWSKMCTMFINDWRIFEWMAKVKKDIFIISVCRFFCFSIAFKMLYMHLSIIKHQFEKCFQASAHHYPTEKKRKQISHDSEKLATEIEICTKKNGVKFCLGGNHLFAKWRNNMNIVIRFVSCRVVSHHFQMYVYLYTYNKI